VNVGGNNVRAYLDRNNDDAVDAGGTPVTTGNFTTSADLKAYPTAADNQAVSVQNLFYLNNVMHDRLYKYGFNEAAGNFQNNNFGKGGATGSDAVNAEAQDGGGLDNANFATPARRFGAADADVPLRDPGSGDAPGRGERNRVRRRTGRVRRADRPQRERRVVSRERRCGDGHRRMRVAAAQVADGKVAIIDRGSCEFATKAKNAETAGAVAAIIANNTGTTEIGTMGEGTQHLRVTIPAVMVGRNDGATIKTLVGQVADASRRDPGAHATRRRPRLGHRVPRVLPWPHVADDRQHERSDGRRDRRGH
jgi:hypothetical protein